MSGNSPLPESLLDPRMAQVWEAARRQLDKWGPDHRGRIQPLLNPHSRQCLTGLLGRAPTKTIDLADLEQALVERGIGSDLDGALSRLGYSPSPEASKRRAKKARQIQVRDTLATETGSWPELWAGQWAATVQSAGLLSDLAPPDAARLTRRVRTLLDHLNTSPNVVESRSELAARLYGDSHALDNQKKLFRFVEHALRLRTGRSDLGGRELFEQAGIEHCLVSAPVLTWAIPAIGKNPIGEQLRAANRGGLPSHINLYTLRHCRVRVPPETRVLVVENPRLVEAAVDRGLPACVIASNGMPTTAVTTLLDQLTDSNAQVWFHTDFDPAGFRIGNLWAKKGYRPWMMTHIDYLKEVHKAEEAGLELPADPSPRPCVEVLWDRQLGTIYQDTGKKVHEELLTGRILDGFAADAEINVAVG